MPADKPIDRGAPDSGALGAARSYVLLIYPTVDEALVGRIRRAYDPTVEVVRPHIPVVFPVPESIGLDRLATHIANVLEGYPPMEIRFGGLVRSQDHWLFLTLDRGNESLSGLYRQLHTGLLADYAADRYTPHLGLGHFLIQGAVYDWEHPRVQDFDAARYELARREAGSLLAGPVQTIDALHLVVVPNEVLEWSSGQRSRLPEGVRVDDVCAFPLGPAARIARSR